MDGLINTTLIKSAKFDFASLNLDGNTLFIGANGAGKTTLLRAVLFFYTGNSDGLGISRVKKISFADYYFPYEESYITYTYKKAQKYVLVVVYKDSGIKFLFSLFDEQPNIKEIFIEEDNRPIDFANLRIKLKKISNLSNIVQNGAKYKEILYSRNVKEKEYSLFEAREYDSFTRTLSNIFINSKVDSSSIKKVIVSSLNLDTFIDISQLQRFLKDFNTLYEDILLYEKSNKDILKTIEFLKEYEQTKVFMEDEFKTLFSSKEFVKSKIELTQKEFEEIIRELEKNREIFEKDEDKFNRARNLFIGKNATIKEFLKKCEEKSEYYQAQDIQNKIEDFSQKNSIESRLKIEVSRKEFLVKEHTQIQQFHENQIEKINNSFISQKNRLDKQIFDIKEEEKEKISKIEKQEFEIINDIKENFNKKRLDFKDSLQRMNNQNKDLDFERKESEKDKFIFLEEDILKELNTQKNISLQSIKDKKQDLKQLDTKLSSEEKLFIINYENKAKEFDNQLEDINSELLKLQTILSPKEGSLIHGVYKNSSNANYYLHFLKDEILHSKIDFDFKTFENRFFELDLKDFQAPNTNINLKIEELKTKYNQKLKEKTKLLENLENEFKFLQNKIYKDKKDLNEAIKDLEINLNLIEVKITKLLLDKQKEQKIFEEDKDKKIQNLTNQTLALSIEIKELNAQYEDLNKLEQNEIKTKKTESTKKINTIKDIYLVPIKNKQIEISNLEKELQSRLEDQNNSYKEILKNKNIDIQKLELLENEIRNLEKSLDQINSYQTIIIEYSKDKKEYLEKQNDSKKELRVIKEEFGEIENKFLKIKEIFESEKKDLKLKEEELKVLLFEKRNDLKNILTFEQNPTFERYKTLGFKYEINENTKEDITNILSSLETLKEQYEGGYKKIQNQIMKLMLLFNSSLGIKKFLDEIDTAYGLKEYFEQNTIEQKKELLGSNIDKIIKYIVDNYDKLLDSQGQIKSLINKITKLFSTINISVIDSLELRYQESSNKIIEIISKIKSENEDNDFGISSNLFSTSSDSAKLVKLLKDLIDTIEHDNINKIDLEDSFILEFRVVENKNDSKWLSSLDMIGSNGTDVLVKSMIYIAMLHIFKEQSTKKELMVQAVLDEVGILSQRYLKELIEFANKYGILFVNGAPDEKLIGTYKRVSLISNINSMPVVKELIVK